VTPGWLSRSSQTAIAAATLKLDDDAAQRLLEPSSLAVHAKKLVRVVPGFLEVSPNYLVLAKLICGQPVLGFAGLIAVG